MTLTRRDWIFAGAVAILLGLLLLSNGTNRARGVPGDNRHHSLNQKLAAGISRQEVERECTVCHSSKVIPLPKAHPPKEQCLICHRMNKEEQTHGPVIPQPVEPAASSPVSR
jgi:hypothetical protein